MLLLCLPIWFVETISVDVDKRFEMLALLCAYCVDEWVDGRWGWLDTFKRPDQVAVKIWNRERRGEIG